MITDAEGRTFTFDAENKQTQVKDANDAVIGTYSYDGDGKRVKKAATTENIVFVYDAAGKLVEEYSGSTLQTAYVYAGSRLLTTETATGTSYLTSDHLGSPRINTDATGNVTARHDYMPFGEEIFSFGGRTTGLGYSTDSIRKKFTGYERDSESDLDFAHARYYNSAHGRFGSADNFLNDTRVSDTQSWNLYVYVRNNPLLLTDPNGERIYAGNITDQKDKDEFLKRANYTYGCDSCVTIDKDGYVQVDTTRLNKDVINATAFLTNAINSTDRSQLFSVEISNNNPDVAFGDSGTRVGVDVKNADGTVTKVSAINIRLDFADDAQVKGGTEADKASFLNLVFAHEVSHFAPDHKLDPTSYGPRGPVDNPINEIRLARGLPLRAGYQARSLGSLVYIKFGEANRDRAGNVVRGSDGVEVVNDTGRLVLWVQKNVKK